MIQVIKRFYIVGFLLVVTVIFSLYYNFTSSEKIILKNTQRITELSTQVLEREITAWLFMNSQIVADAGDYIVSAPEEEEFILNYLKKLLEKNPGFSSLYYVKTDNSMLNASGWKPPENFDSRMRPWYVKAVEEKNIIYSQAFLNGSKDDLIISIAKPVYNSEKKLLGVVSGDISLKTIIGLVRNKAIREQGYSFLVDGKNNILAHPGYEYNIGSKLINLNESSVEIGRLMTQKEFGVEKVVMNGVDGYLAYQPIKNTDWKIGSFIPIDEYGDKSNEQKTLFSMTILMLLLLFLLFIWLQKRYVLNPILQLDRNIRKIDIAGDLAYRLPMLKNDDFASLDESINLVLDTTQKYFLKIEKEEAALQQQHLLLLENEKKLRAMESRWNFALEGAGDGVWDWNIQTNEVFFSVQWKRMLGFTDEEIQNDFAEWDKLIHPDDKEYCYDKIAKYIRQEVLVYQVEHRLLCKDGRYKWILSRAKFLEWTEDGKPLRLIGTHADISNIKAMENALAEEKELLKMTLLSVGDGVITTDNNRKITMLNQVAEATTGWTREDSMGKTFEEVFTIIDEVTGEQCESPVQRALESGKNVFLEKATVLVSKDGTKISIADSAAPIKDFAGNIKGVVVVFRDVTIEKKGQEQIEYLSYHDQLTGLYNRSFFEAELRRVDTKRNLPLTIIMADVNGLKITNDAFGHIIGDNLLKKSAKILKKACRGEDIIARLGGDEFIILLPKATQQEAENIIERIKILMAKTHVDVIGVSMAFGFATKNEVVEDIQEIIKQADNSMYKNKSLESHVVKSKLIKSIQTLYKVKTKEEIHSQMVGQLCRRIGSAYRLSEEKLQQLETLGLWHDIGKASLDESIINQVGELSETQWVEMKKHPEIGNRILKSVSELAEVGSYVLAHHERWDGTGYPKGLKGEEIPWAARVVAIAEAYEAMCSERSYQKAVSKELALEELKKQAGKQFDPDMVKKFIKLEKAKE